VRDDRDQIDRLFADARSHRPYDQNREHGFETRVMAKIKEQRVAQAPFFLWAWRLIPALSAAVLMLGIWTYAAERPQIIGLNLMAGINGEETMLVASLTGE